MDKEEMKALLTRHNEELYELYRNLRQDGELFAACSVYSATDCLDSALEELGGRVIVG